MKNIPLLAGACALAIFALAQEPEQAPPPPPAITEADHGTKVQITQIDTDEFPDVTVYYNVTRGGTPIAGLTRENFLLKENGVEHELVEIGVQLEPVTVVLLIDISGSMKNALADAQAAAIEFLNLLYEEDHVVVMTFHEKIDVIYPRGNDLEAASQAIAGTRVRGDTALYDGIQESIDEVKDVPGRKVIVVLSDGVDDDGRGRQLSKNDLDKPLLAAMTENIPIYTIGLGENMDEGVLRAFGGATGAEYLASPTTEELGALYDRIGQQLAGQYALTYRTEEPGDGGIREVNLNLLIASNKGFAAPEQVLDKDGNVAAYQAPKLTDKEKAQLVQMSDLPKMAKDFGIKELDPFLNDEDAAGDKWPTSAPAIEGAENQKATDDGYEFTLNQDSKKAAAGLAETLKAAGWKIDNESSAGKIHVVEASKAGEKLSLAVVGNADGKKSTVTAEHVAPVDEPIRIERNGLDQIIESNGREIVVSGSNCRLKILGGTAKLTVTGDENRFQADAIDDLQVSGTSNLVSVSTLTKGRIPGDKNTVIWARGAGGVEPKIESSGEENEVTQLK